MPKKQAKEADDELLSEEDLRDMFAEAIAATQAASGPRPIGVPEDYIAQREETRRRSRTRESRQARGDAYIPRETTLKTWDETTVVPRPPRFMDGDQYVPAGMSPAKIAALQRQMIALGVIPGDAEVRLGMWDDVTLASYERLLAFANQAGIDSVAGAMDAWGRATAEFGVLNAGGGGRSRAGLPIRVTSPTDLKPVFRKTVMDVLGTGWGEKEINDMIDAYQHIERARQVEANAISESGGTGVVEAPPSADAFAEEFARERDPIGAQTQELISGANQFFDMIQGGWDG